MALIEAKAGKTNPTISKMLQFCFSYDPEGRTYVLNITRIFGIIILVSIGLVVGFLSLRRSKVKKKKGVLING
jgi:protein SCO1/2